MKPRKLKRGTTPKSPESTEPTNSDSNNSAAQSNALVREFLYLDYPKLTSYYAQLFNGARKDFTHTRSASKEESTQPPVTTQGFEATASAGTGDAASFARLLGLVADMHLKVSRLVEASGTTLGRTEAEVTAETTELHHDILQRVEANLAAADLIETSTTKKGSTKPFYRVTGRASIIPFDDMIRFVDENEALSRALEGLGHEGTGTIANAKHLSYVLTRFYAADIAIVVSTGGGAVSAILDPQHIQSPLRHILNAYGRLTQVPITILGVGARRAEAGQQKRIKVGNFVSDLPRQLLSVNESLHTMDNISQFRADLHLFPIAVYIDPMSRLTGKE